MPDKIVREDGRRCSMSAFMDGPWSCGSGDCMGLRPDCTVPVINAAELHWLEVRERDDAWENGWREALDLPLITYTMRDAREAVDRLAR